MRHPAVRLLTALIATVLITSAAWAQEPSFQITLPGFEGLGGPGGEPGLKYKSSFVIDTAQGVGEVRLSIEMNDGWCVYSTTQPAGGPMASRISLKPNPAIVTLGKFVPTTKPKIVPAGDIIRVAQEKHYHKVEWTAPFILAPNIDPAQLQLDVIYNGQTCQDGGSCIPKNEKVVAKFAGQQSISLPADFKAPQALDAPVKLVPDNNYVITGKTGLYTTPVGHSIISGKISPPVVVPGEKVTVTISVTPTDSYHVYAYSEHDQPSGDKLKGYKPTLIVLAQDTPLTMSAPVASKPVIEKPNGELFEVIKYHDGPTSWTFNIEIPKDAPLGRYPLVGYLGYQTCTDTTCDRPSAVQFETIIEVAQQSSPGGAALAFSEQSYNTPSEIALANHPAAKSQTDAEIAPIAAVEPEAVVEEPPIANSDAISWKIINQDSKSQNLGLIIVFSFIGGMILNLMPCVLPVVGLKIMSFVDQAGKSRVRVFMLNLVYSLGVIAVFMVLACLLAFAGMAWGEHSGNPIFIIAMTSVVFVFALSLLGIWEIGLPGFVGSGKASELSREEGYTGAFAKGALTTVLSTPCSGPFLGPIFAYTISVPTHITFLIFACIGLGMASPYLVIGVFPKMIRFLPKPGNWMVTFKQLMGFVMLLTAVYLLYTLKDDLVIATLTFLIGLGIACWLIGRVPLTEPSSSHAKAWLTGLTTAGVIAAFSFMFLQTGAHHEGWQTIQQNDLAKMQQDIYEMQAEGTTVMVDFTADWCPTCQLNFANAINTTDVNEYAGKNSVARRIVDWSDTASPQSEHIKDFVTDLRANSIPVLAIFPAGKPGNVIVLSDLLDEATVLKHLQDAGPSTRSLPLKVEHTASVPH